jgi:hypothetical protein
MFRVGPTDVPCCHEKRRETNDAAVGVRVEVNWGCDLSAMNIL